MSPLGKQSLRGALALMLLAAHSLAFAAREEHVFEVSVTIPTAEFYVLPIDPGFLEREQRMGWNRVNNALDPINALFDVHSSSGAITARLGYEPKLSNDRFDIALQVKFNNQLLSLSSTEVVNELQARDGLRVPLRIEAPEPADGFKPGDYFGNVLIIFDSQLPSG